MGSYWALEIWVDGVLQSALDVPFVAVVAGFGQSIGVPLKKTTHVTGTNCTILAKVRNITGGGNVTLGAPFAQFQIYNQSDSTWRKSI